MGLLSDIRRDWRAVFERDPAAKSAFNVLMLNSGLHSLIWYRIAHLLYRVRIPFIPSLITVCVRLICGIEIHPAARLGGGLFIDHGTGVVIGETSEVGEDCLLYQGVTLGGTGKEQGKRHPTLGRGVVVGAGAKVLGNIKIGDYVKIGANAVVLKNVPDHSIVVGVPGRVIKKKVYRVHEEGPVEVLDHVSMPDPVEEKFRELEGYIRHLEKKLKALEARAPGAGETEGITMRLYNTMTGKKEVFEPIEPGKVGMYACGVTVYDNCHIGHARSAVVFDMIRQYLRYKGFDVRFIKNFTDVDDKIINRANERQVAWDALARQYTEKYQQDMDRLNVEPADVEPLATEHIREIIDIVKGLIEKGNAYELDGDVYFEVESFGDYGKLSGRRLEDMQAGARVAVDERKKSPADFALWKQSKEGEPSWESPWGPGRPGWHIECSAMSLKHLGESFDIHGGGADLTFPHHENELAQSEAYTGKEFVRYWVHNGFITVDKEKMSKSLGNFFTIEEILDKFDPEVVRLFLLHTHYRSPIEFSDEQLRETESSLDRAYLTIARAGDFIALSPGKKDKSPGGDEMEAFTAAFNGRFEEAMDDDFNTALAIGHMYEMVREMNRFLDGKPSGQRAQTLVKDALDALKSTSHVLRVFERTPLEWYRAIMKYHVEGIAESDVESMIAERTEARANKDWARSDAIRDELAEKGIVIEDKPGGITTWRIKVG
jgi:cysteinyl-tRNA synthetase